MAGYHVSDLIMQSLASREVSELSFKMAVGECDRMVLRGLDVMPKISRVIYNDPATIVFWNDGTKTVVKCQEGDVYDEKTGLLLCYVKRAHGNTSRGLNDFLRRWEQ